MNLPMELPSFFDRIEVNGADLDVCISWGPWDGLRIMAAGDKRSMVLIHEWNSATADVLYEANTVEELLKEIIARGDGDMTVDEFLSTRGGGRYDGLGNVVGWAITEGDAKSLKEWIE